MECVGADCIKYFFSDYNSQCDSSKSGPESGFLGQVVLSTTQIFCMYHRVTL